MSTDESAKNPFPELWRWWVESPWTQSWLAWQRLLWASHPMSRLIPLDSEEIWQALVHLGEDLAGRPEHLQAGAAELLRQSNELALWTLRRFNGPEPAEPVTVGRDRRFKDEAWTNNLIFSVIKQSYLILSRWYLETAEQMPCPDAQECQRTRFYIRQFVDALSPTNFLLTNPTVLRETLDTGGENLRRGLQNLLDDLERGEITLAGKEQFTVGENLALTPGQVVFRNPLIELIQYAPATEQVYTTPLLITPPWINKYYIMDIRPGRSMVEYLVQQGFTVFLISWRNPDASLQHLTLEDYLQQGPLEALQVVKAITGVPKVHMVGYCIGGTLLAIALAYLHSVKDDSVRSATFFTALQDFSEVGETAVFISEEWIAEIERRMAGKGYLDAIEMNALFRLLRSNDLIWNYVVNNYLMGKEPLPFDLIYWSSDGTRMPRTMHSYYLRNMYLENNLVKPNRLTMLGQGIDLSKVRCPCYVVGGQEDHIVPWQSAHRARQLFSGPTRLVLGHGGHIGSVINPPAKGKGYYFTNESDTTDPAQWLKTATRNEGSWWVDWVQWLRRRSGKKRPPYPLGNDQYPPLVSAPGTYVLEE